MPGAEGMWTTIHIALDNIHQSMQIHIIFKTMVMASILKLHISREVSMTLQFGQEAMEHRHHL
jgi:hypothetical protein